jgi:hypothetical protein
MNDPRSARDVPAKGFCLHAPIASADGWFCNCCREPLTITAKSEAKPSPREVLLKVVEELERRHKDCRFRYDHAEYAATASEANGEGRAYRDAITLIRSMAGHLMEQTDGH